MRNARLTQCQASILRRLIFAEGGFVSVRELWVAYHPGMDAEYDPDVDEEAAISQIAKMRAKLKSACRIESRRRAFYRIAFVYDAEPLIALAAEPRKVRAGPLAVVRNRIRHEAERNIPSIEIPIDFERFLAAQAVVQAARKPVTA